MSLRNSVKVRKYLECNSLSQRTRESEDAERFELGNFKKKKWKPEQTKRFWTQTEIVRLQSKSLKFIIKNSVRLNCVLLKHSTRSFARSLSRGEISFDLKITQFLHLHFSLSLLTNRQWLTLIYNVIHGGNATVHWYRTHTLNKTTVGYVDCECTHRDCTQCSVHCTHIANALTKPWNALRCLDYVFFIA